MRERIEMSNNLYAHVFGPDYAAVHSWNMQHSIPALLRKMMDALPGNQTALAKRLTQRGRGKVTQPQISRWLREQEPDRDNYDRIIAVAQELGVLSDVRSEDVADIISVPPRSRKVKLKGYVGASGEAIYYRLSDEDYEEVDAPSNATDQTIAVEIKGKSFGPLMNTWLVFYDDVRSPVTPDLHGQICVVGLDDDRILIKEIQPNGRGGFTLISNSADDPIENANIEWAAKVTSMRPR